MKKLAFLAILAMPMLSSACQSTSDQVKLFLEDLGIVEKPFNPDQVTITLIELKESLPTYMTNLQTIYDSQVVIRNLQIKLEKIDSQMRRVNNPQLQQILVSDFRKTFQQRVLIQERCAFALDEIHKEISLSKRKRAKIVSQINEVLPSYNGNPGLRDKLKIQRAHLDTLGKQLQTLSQASHSTGKTLEAMFDYTLTYDNNHPRIYGSASDLQSR